MKFIYGRRYRKDKYKKERIPALKILLTTSMGCSNHTLTIGDVNLKAHHPNGVNLHKKYAYFLKKDIFQ